MNTILVLEDGETFSGIGDSKILWITDAGMELLEDGDEPSDLEDTYIKRCVYISDLLKNEEIKRDMP